MLLLPLLAWTDVIQVSITLTNFTIALYAPVSLSPSPLSFEELLCPSCTSLTVFQSITLTVSILSLYAPVSTIAITYSISVNHTHFHLLFLRSGSASSRSRCSAAPTSMRWRSVFWGRARSAGCACSLRGAQGRARGPGGETSSCCRTHKWGLLSRWVQRWRERVRIGI